MKWIILVVGIVGVLLGGLWLLQGLGLVHVQPILCVAECETLEGPAPASAIAGLVVLAGGALAVYYALRRAGRPPGS